MTTATKERARAVVVLSGGQDSVTCLALAVRRHNGGHNVRAISFNYGQRHAAELECAREACEALGVPAPLVVNIPIIDSVSALVASNGGNVSDPHAEKPNLPASFVRNRNALFLTYAHAYAQDLGAECVYVGVCQTDYSGYPDCRRDFVDSLEDSLNLGYQAGVVFETPLMFKTKADTFALAADLQALDVVLEHSHTCYNGDREHRHAWGYGCGECPACQLRAKGWEDFKTWVHYSEFHGNTGEQA
jgi:7-cyano-7-deazaguanine synthase